MDKVKELLTRGVDKIYPSKQALEKILRSGRKLRLYQGFDPTGDKLHIGHMTGLMKLKQFQDLGHEVIFLIGDGTGQAGDPSGKTKAREKFFNNKELRNNAKDYVGQASKIVRFSGKNPAKILYNSEWLNKLSLVELLNIAQNFSLQQLEERDLFVKRKQKGESINMREFLYPLLQGYDSVAMKVDLELGGSDQTFNMLCGRTLLKNILKKEKFVMTTPLLTDSQGRKIGKSEGNVIALTAHPNELYGMIMNLSDEVIVKCFEFLTQVPIKEIKEISKNLNKSPMLYKKKLALNITSMLNDQKKAQAAQDEFEKVIQNRQAPSQIPEFDIKNLSQNPINILNLLTKTKLANSRAEAKRLIKQKAVTINEKKVTGVKSLKISKQDIIKTGKRKWLQFK